MVTQDQLDKTFDSFHARDNSVPCGVKFHENTSEEGYKKATYVMNRSRHVGCTCNDFGKFVKDGLNNPYLDCAEQHDVFDAPFRSVGMVSPGVLRLQEQINSNSHKAKMPEKLSQHDKDLNIHLLSRSTPTTGRKTRDECRKNVITNLDQLINSDRISDDQIRKFDAAVEKLKHDIFMSLENDQTSPDHYSSSECESITPSVKKAASGKSDVVLTDNILDGHFEMACDESEYKKREERLKNGLG